MEMVVQLIMQAGALGLLAYLIWWGTQTGAPNFFAAMAGIQAAIHRNTTTLENLEEKIVLQTAVLVKIVEGSHVINDSVREEARSIMEQMQKSAPR